MRYMPYKHRLLLFIFLITISTSLALPTAARSLPQAVTLPEPLKTISMPNGVTDIAIDPALHRAYALSTIASTIYMIDTSTNTLSPSAITSVPFPANIDVNTINHRIYVASWEPDSAEQLLFFLDGNTYSIIKTVTIPSHAASISVSKSTNKLYVLSNDTVYVYNSTTGSYITTFGLSNGSYSDMRVNPVTHLIYSAGESFTDNFVSVMDEDSFAQPLLDLPCVNKNVKLAINDIDNQITATCQDSLYVFNGASSQLISSATIGQSLYGVAVNTSTGDIFTSDVSGDTIYAVNSHDGSIIGSRTLGGTQLAGLAADPTTNLVYAADVNKNVIVLQDSKPSTPCVLGSEADFAEKTANHFKVPQTFNLGTSQPTRFHFTTTFWFEPTLTGSLCESAIVKVGVPGDNTDLIFSSPGDTNTTITIAKNGTLEGVDLKQEKAGFPNVRFNVPPTFKPITIAPYYQGEIWSTGLIDNIGKIDLGYSTGISLTESIDDSDVLQLMWLDIQVAALEETAITVIVPVNGGVEIGIGWESIKSGIISFLQQILPHFAPITSPNSVRHSANRNSNNMLLLPTDIRQDLETVFTPSFMNAAQVSNLSVDNTEIQPGQSIHFTGSGFSSNGRVAIVLSLPSNGSQTVLMDVRADTNGAINGQINLPNNARGGRWILAAVDTETIYTQLTRFANTGELNIQNFVEATNIHVPSRVYMPLNLR